MPRFGDDEKMPAFWESIKLAEALLTAQMDE